jgi:hypothetical protein
VSIPSPRRDQVVLTDPGGARLCNSLACTQAGTLAEVIVTYGVLNDPGASLYARGALWRECWSRSYPLYGGCWMQSRQVAIKVPARPRHHRQHRRTGRRRVLRGPV